MRRPRTTLRAFRGGHSYEGQVGRLVLQARHRDWRSFAPWNQHFRPRLLNVWIDPLGRWV